MHQNGPNKFIVDQYENKICLYEPKFAFLFIDYIISKELLQDASFCFYFNQLIIDSNILSKKMKYEY